MTEKPKNSRLDVVLVERGYFASREQAQRAIMAGEVRVGDAVIDKSSAKIKPDAEVFVRKRSPYVGRGGLKLEGALDHFQISVAGLTALDIGASTGGFTDCLMQRGAAKVYAVDVGQGQLAWKLRQDQRVVVMEKTNARELAPAKFPQPFAPADLAVIDCSFISLRKILPAIVALLKAPAKIVALIKPQFEAGKE